MILITASTSPESARPENGPAILAGRARLLVVHRGALGDFLNLWPSLLALRQAFPRLAMTCSAPVAHRPLCERIGLPRASAEDERAFPGLYADAEPPALRDAAILWFGLAKRPDLAHGAVHFLPGLVSGDWRPPRELWLEGLARLGVPGEPHRPARTPGPDRPDWSDRSERPCWQEAWRARICRAAGPARSRRVLLFPGAGHPAKAWPLAEWLALARWLAAQGWEPLVTLGPQEQEKGMDAAPWPTARPRTLDDLLALMRGAGLGLGGDSGPLHLASLCGLPGVALFGPTSARQWGPPGLTILRGRCPRRPCTVTTADLRCAAPTCLTAIDQATVRQAVRDLCPDGPP